MSLIRYRNPSILDDFRREMNDLFNGSLPTTNQSQSDELNQASWAPHVDIKEDDNRFVVWADMPGMQGKDLDVHVDDNHRLVIKGEACQESKEEKKDFIRIERRSGSFYRAFQLPDNIDAEGINAKVKDGVLEVTIPKAQKITGRKVPVEG